MDKKTGRPKKYINTGRIAIVINIINPWRDTAVKLEKLSEVDVNEDFKKYCDEIEGTDLEKKGPNKLSTYCRWVLSNHVVNNLNTLTGTI